jgi:hypothetical protein
MKSVMDHISIRWSRYVWNKRSEIGDEEYSGYKRRKTWYHVCAELC